MKRWTILAALTTAAALAAACGSKSSGNGDETSDDGGGSSQSSSSSGSSGGATGVPVVAVDGGTVAFACESASDCTSPQLCCGTFGVTSATSACATGPCPTGPQAAGYAEQLCTTDTECPLGNSCLPVNGYTDIDVCVDDDAGNTGIPSGDGSVFVSEAGPSGTEAGTTPVDAGHEVEASVMDAESPVDASSSKDASGSVEAGVDAGHPADAAASTTDAGPHDAATGG